MLRVVFGCVCVLFVVGSTLHCGPSTVSDEKKRTESTSDSARVEIKEEPDITSAEATAEPGVDAAPDATGGTDTSEPTPEQKPPERRDVPDKRPEATPDATPDVIADAVPDTSPDTTPDTTPDAVTETTPDVTPDAVPDVVADVAPDAVPDAVPDVADGGLEPVEPIADAGESVPEVQDALPEQSPEMTPDVMPAMHVWAQGGGSTGDDTSMDIALDSSGDVYVAGSLLLSGKFGTASATSTGSRHGFVAKIDAKGVWKWATSTDLGGQFGMTARVNAIKVGPAGNIYVAGFIQGKVKFGTTTIETKVAGEFDSFVAKLDKTGKWLWAKRAGSSLTGTSNHEQANDLVVTKTGQVVITGDFVGSADFGTTTLKAKGAHDIYVAMLDTTGKWLWARRCGSTAEDYGRALVLSSAGNIWLLGNSFGNADVGTTNFVKVGDDYTILAELDALGVWKQAIQLRGTKSVRGTDMVMNAQGELAVIGDFTGIMTAGSTARTAVSIGDIFVALLDAQGKWKWLLQAGLKKPQSPRANNGYGVAFDSMGNVYITGRYNQYIRFGPSLLQSNDLRFWRTFVAKANKQGSWEWGIGVATVAADSTKIAVDSNDNVYVTGRFGFTSVFGTTTLVPTANRKYDVFVWKLK